MRLFARPNHMRYSWFQNDDGQFYKYITDEYGEPARRYKNNFDVSWYSNGARKASEMGFYLAQGVISDPCPQEQPFLPKRPHLVARSFHLDDCVIDAVESVLFTSRDYRMYHVTKKNISPTHLKRSVTQDIDPTDRNVYYIYSGILFRIQTKDVRKLEAFDTMFRGSPEVRRVLDHCRY